MQNKSPILIALETIYHGLHPVLEAKGKDYATTDDIFKNLKLCEPLVGVSAEKGVIIRLSDKLSRISNLLEKDAEVKSESVFDTIIDIVGYSSILYALLQERDMKRVVGRAVDPISIGSGYPTFVENGRKSMHFTLPDGTQGRMFDDGVIEFIQCGDFVANTVGKNSN